MINSRDQLELTQQRINELELSLASARRRLGGNKEVISNIVSLYQNPLEELEGEIRQYLGLSVNPTAPFEIAFDTKDGTNGTATLSSLLGVAEGFRHALISVGEKLSNKTARSVGRPPMKVSRAVDLRIVGITNGSFRLLMEFPVVTPDQKEEEIKNLVGNALDVLYDTARWVESKESAIPQSIEDSSLREVALSEIRRLSPTENSTVSWVEFKRNMASPREPARLTVATLRAANSIIESATKAEVRSLAGKLRAIDLDRSTFSIEDLDGKRHKCSIPKILLKEALSTIVSQSRVIVRGHRKSRSGVFEVITLEPIKDESDQEIE